MSVVTFTRWIALAARDTLTVDLPDGVDPIDVDPEQYPIIAECREVIDSTDSGTWEVRA
jgi:hypothetical protein